MTQEGFDKLQEELHQLRTTGRAEVSEKIRIARGFGDLSENSEYDEAKNDQAVMEARIAQLEEQLKHVEIIDHDDIATDAVSVGSLVKILDVFWQMRTEMSAFCVSMGKSQIPPLDKRLKHDKIKR